MALLDLQGMEPVTGDTDERGGSEVSLLICGNSELSVVLCTP
jgi:hypothetical protein